MEQVSQQERSHLIVIISALEDDDLREDLEQTLAPLERKNILTIWSNQNILAGTHWQKAYQTALEKASAVLLLLSTRFLADDQCYQMMQRALKYQASNAVHMFPILLRPVSLEDTPFHELVCLPRNGKPVVRWTYRDEAFQEIVTEIRKALKGASPAQNKQLDEKELRLRALIADHRSFMQNRLESFVGRQKELDEIQQQVTQQLPKGGYITITGQAGQGKSSIIAKLIDIYGVDQVAYHFIPINPGPDHQVGLLRNLMARLILKYHLPDFYVASDNRAALRDHFIKVLDAVIEEGGKEIIFIDGLDQLEEDLSDVRDLTFLPTNPPPGILFVLGTRPNDTLKPLELLKPHGEYWLPNLSRHDFDLILQHHQVVLKPDVADQFYKLMDENALYLDLVAKELKQSDTVTPEEIIKRISANPDNLFFLSIERFKRQPLLWEKVIYPVLGILLTAQRPLSQCCIRNIVKVEDYRLREGITKLGGLLAEDGRQCYSLFHLKFRDYLHQNE